jgi:AbrB family looped-hinge helix DNA binding protein
MRYVVEKAWDKESLVASSFSTITTKGQLVIPSRLRRKYGIRKGTRVAMIEEENRIILQPLTREYVRKLRGSLKGKTSAMKFLLEGRSQDREL